MSKIDFVIGMGEIGRAIMEISDHRDISYYDRNEGSWTDLENEVRILHIAIPFSKDFIKEVKRYQKLTNPEYTVIHSTVPIGTSRKLQAIHSPVVGVHPHLATSLKVFTKFFGGPGASEVADIFKRLGVNVYVTDKAETTELMKLACTANYGLNIEFTKMVKQECNKYDVPFEIFTVWNNNYNQGYERLNMPQYHRYNLIPLMKKVGGHCVIPNLSLWVNKFTKFLKELA